MADGMIITRDFWPDVMPKAVWGWRIWDAFRVRTEIRAVKVEKRAQIFYSLHEQAMLAPVKL
jgi:hypothetical protein